MNNARRQLKLLQREARLESRVANGLNPVGQSQICQTDAAPKSSTLNFMDAVWHGVGGSGGRAKAQDLDLREQPDGGKRSGDDYGDGF